MTKVSGVKMDAVYQSKAKKNGDVRQTKNGNPYYHSNTWKKVGAGVSIAGGLVGAGIMFAMTRNVKAALSVLPFAIPSLATGVIGGAIIDGAVNHHEKKKADALNAYA